MQSTGMKNATATPMLEGQVNGDVIRLPRGARLADGMRVGIIPLDPLKTDTPFLKTMLKLASKRVQANPRTRKANA